jgi:hypothetical protein
MDVSFSSRRWPRFERARDTPYGDAGRVLYVQDLAG